MAERATDQESSRVDFAAVLRGRRSIDLFEPEPAGTEALLQAIELARWAPNHRLTEPWRFHLVGPKTKEAIIELAAAIDTAAKGERAGALRRDRWRAIPAFFVLTSRIGGDPLLERENYAACCCAAQTLMLYLWQCGIGTKWTTGDVTRDGRFYRLLGIDVASEAVVGLFWYGRPKVIPTQRRGDVAEIIREHP